MRSSHHSSPSVSALSCAYALKRMVSSAERRRSASVEAGMQGTSTPHKRGAILQTQQKHVKHDVCSPRELFPQAFYLVI